MRDEAGQDEQHAGDEAAARPVQQPADIGRELLRLGPGQQHAVVQRVQEPLSPIQRFSSTRMRCMTAICPAGPPKLSSATRSPDAQRLARAHACWAAA